MNKLRPYLLLLAVLLALVIMPCAYAAESHPGLTTITSGVSVGDGSYINHDDSGYPFRMTFLLDEGTIPLQSCRLGIYSWDCDEISSTWHYEYDMVYVNNVFVGVLTGQDSTWKTSYFEVPLSALKLGENEITVYVGHKEKDTGTIVKNTDYWLLTIDWASLQYDGGVSINAPETFDLMLEYATETENGIQCGAKAYIVSNTVRSYVIEYSLVDKTSPSSPTYNQIIADDEEYLSGTTLYSTGFFNLGEAPTKGTYVIQCTLRDPSTNEVYDYEELAFDMEEALNGGCDHQPSQENTLVRKAYRMLAAADPAHDTEHEEQDIYWNICTECLETYTIYNGWERASHNTPVCACGYVIPGYNPIKSASLAPVNDPYVNCDYVITVVTDEYVAHLEAVNNNDHPLGEVWTRTEMGDGTVRWTCVYRPTTSAKDRYWTVTAYNVNNREMSNIETNRVDITNGTPTEVENPEETTATYTIRVLDKKTAKAISGATVQLCGQVQSTDAEGNAVFDYNALGSSGLVVSKSGSKYHQVEKSGFVPGTKGGMTIIQLTDEKFAFTKAECNDKDVLVHNSQINTKAELLAEIEVELEVSNGATVNGYKIMQGGTVLGESQKGIFSIDNSRFAVGQPVRVVADVTYSSGMSNTIEEDLKITVVSFGKADLPEGMEKVLDFFGRFSIAEFEVGKGDEDKVLSKIANALLKFANEDDEAELEFPFEYGVDNEKVTLSYNKGEDDETDLNKVMQKAVDKYNKKHANNSKKSASAQQGFEVEITLGINFHFNETGLHAVSGVVVSSVGLNAEADISTAIGPVPVVLEAEGSISGVGTADKFGYDAQAKKVLLPDLGIGINGQITMSVGVGFKLFGVEASAGVYGAIGTKLDSTFTFEKGGSVQSITFSGEAGIYAEVDVGPFEHEMQIRIWPGNEGGGSKTIKLGGKHGVVYLTADAEADSLAARFRDSRKQASNGMMVSDVGFIDSTAEMTAATMPAHIDDEAEPQLASAGSTTMMVFLDEDGDASDTANTTHLVYSLWNGDSWDAPIRIAQSDIADGPFKLYSDSQDIYLAYMQLNRLLDNSEMPNAADGEAAVIEKLYAGLSHFDVFVAKYVPGQGFVSLGRLSEDEVYDFSVDLTVVDGLPVVTFIKSADTATVTDQNALCVARMDESAQWTVTTLLENSPSLSNARVGLLNGKVCVAAVQETGDSENNNILLWEDGGNVKTIDTGLCTAPVFGEVNGQQALLWYADGAVMQLTSASGSAQTIVGGGAGTDLAIIPCGSSTVLTFTAQNADGGSALYGVALGASSAPVALMADEHYIFAYDALPLADGLYMAWRSAAVTSGSSVSTMKGAYIPFGAALTDALISYDEYAVLPGAMLPVEGIVYNGGIKRIANVKVLLNGVEAEAIACAIPSGEWGEIAFSVQLPAEMKGEIAVTFQAEGTSAVTPVCSIALERNDFALVAEELYLADMLYLQYSVQNVGTVDGSVTLHIKADDANGDVLHTMVIDLAAQHVENDILDVTGMIGRTENRTLHIELVNNAEESTLENNAVSVYFPEF